MIELTPPQSRYLRALAHHLNPVVMIGNGGLTEAVMRELARNLDAHELIKVRVFTDERAARQAIQVQICEHLDCAFVQHIGKLLVLYRPAAEPVIVLPEVGQKRPPVKKVAEPAPRKKPVTRKIFTGRPGGRAKR